MFSSNASNFSINKANQAAAVPKVDSSQIGKLVEGGYAVTPISNDPSIVENLTPTIKQTMPGIGVPGFSANNGAFVIVDENNTVHNVTYTGGNLNNNIDNPPQTGGPLYPPPTLPYNPMPTIPNNPLPLPPANLGSGRIFTRFENGDIVPNQQETITRALWSGNVGNLLTFYTSSAQTSTSTRYYYEIYNSASSDCGSQVQFAVAWGHKQGSGSADEGGQINDTPSRAIYGQYKQLCLDPEIERFVIGGTATDNIYVINVARARMREALDEGNIELNLHALSGSGFMASGNPVNAHTGSNVKILPTRKIIRLIDDSRINSATVTNAGEVYQIVSGTLEDGVYNSSAPHVYGSLYRRLGVMVLNGNTLDQSCSFLTVTGSEIPGDNAWKLALSISGSAKYTDDSGDYLGFQGRSSEKVKSTHFFVRVKNQEYNFSNNPTFVTGSEGDLAEPTFIGDPQVYLTTVGLYNDAKDLIAVAKTSRAIKKNFASEALVKVKLEWVWAGLILLNSMFV